VWCGVPVLLDALGVPSVPAGGAVLPLCVLRRYGLKEVEDLGAAGHFVV
jgi:hypothetical protein